MIFIVVHNMYDIIVHTDNSQVSIQLITKTDYWFIYLLGYHHNVRSTIFFNNNAFVPRYIQ